MLKKALPYIIFALIAILIVFVSFKANSQSFSDYKQYVIENEVFMVKSKVTDTSVTKNSLYLAKILHSDFTESKLIFVISDDKGHDRSWNEIEFFNCFTFFEEKKK